MNQNLLLLLRLQEFDESLDIFQEALDHNSEERSNRESMIQERQGTLAQAREELKGLQLRKKELEIDLESCTQQIKKHQQELNAIKTNEAYKALLLEIGREKAEKNKAEEMLLSIMEELEEKETGLHHREEELKRLEAEDLERIQELENVSESLKAQHEKKLAERKGFETQLPQMLYSRYDSIRSNKRGAVVVQLVGSTCGGCRMTLPPHVLNEIRKDQSLVVCESCARILYEAPSLTPPLTS